MKLRYFILTTIPKYTLILWRRIESIIKVIPFGAFALVIVAFICYVIFDLLFMIIGSFVGMFKRKGELKRYWKSNSVMWDKKLNVSGQYILNALLIKGDVPDHLKFGKEFSTISDQMGRIPKSNDTEVSAWCEDVMLDSIEKDHCAKAVQLNNKALLKRVTELNLLSK